jgi:hypothetical protein
MGPVIAPGAPAKDSAGCRDRRCADVDEPTGKWCDLSAHSDNHHEADTIDGRIQWIGFGTT